MPKKTKKVGRKSVMTKTVLGKLEKSFLMGCSDKEACLYANINPDTLYEYQKKNPEFTERKILLKQNPVLLARQTIINNLTDPKTAKWFLERKAKKEFSINSPFETTEDNEKEPPFNPEHRAKIAEILSKSPNFVMTSISQKSNE